MSRPRLQSVVHVSLGIGYKVLARFTIAS